MHELKKMRTKAGLSQSDLAAKLNVSPNTISQYETGVRSPRISTLKELAKILGCTVDDLLKS